MNELINCLYIHSLACVFNYQVACYEADSAVGIKMEVQDLEENTVMTITQGMFNKWKIHTLDTTIVRSNEFEVQKIIHQLLERHKEKKNKI